MGTTGQSLPNASLPPARAIEAHGQPREARSGPRFGAQISRRFLTGSACCGCMLAITPSCPKRPMSAAAGASMCSIRCRRRESQSTNASRASLMARSPMAWISTCQPRALAAFTASASSPGSHADVPRSFGVPA